MTSELLEPETTLATRLRRLMAAGPLPPERVLAEQLGVTRHAMRRALATLRDQGALPPARAPRQPALLAGSATLARDTNPLEVMELRLALEPLHARLAALRATPAEIARITAAATTRPGADYAAADLDFHRAVATGSRNGLAAAIHALLRQVSADRRLTLAEPLGAGFGPDRLAERDAEHQAIAAAIAARDPDRAESAMRRHLRAVQNKLIEGLSPPG